MSKKLDDELSMATHKKHTIKFKVVFVGDQNVGKSSIINRFIKNQFDATHNPTVGIDFVSKNLQIQDKSIRLQLWDTAGQQRFKSLIPGYLRDSQAIFLIYDVTSRESYNNVTGWIDYVKEHRGDDVCLFIVGNKIDDQEHRDVTTKEAQEHFLQLGTFFKEVSAKSGDNLENLFNSACIEMLKSSDFETTITHADFKNEKKDFNITGERQKPIKRESNKVIPGKQDSKNEKDMRGSKLIKKPQNGKFVRQKNCC